MSIDGRATTAEGARRKLPVQPTYLTLSRDTQPEPWCDWELLARRGHQRCHCNEEGFGTLSRQLGNDEGYRSSCLGVSSPMLLASRTILREGGKDATNDIGRAQHPPGRRRMGGLRHRVSTVVMETVLPPRGRRLLQRLPTTCILLNHLVNGGDHFLDGEAKGFGRHEPCIDVASQYK